MVWFCIGLHWRVGFLVPERIHIGRTWKMTMCEIRSTGKVSKQKQKQLKHPPRNTFSIQIGIRSEIIINS